MFYWVIICFSVSEGILVRDKGKGRKRKRKKEERKGERGKRKGKKKGERKKRCPRTRQ